jgi:putative transposase
MKEYQSQSHVRFECTYHIRLVSQISTKKIYGRLRQQFGEMMRDLCRQKGVELIEGHACPDHVHMCLNIPPKYSVSSIVGFLKGKSAIKLNKDYSKAKSTGKHFWIRSYFVSTVGLSARLNRNHGFLETCCLHHPMKSIRQPMQRQSEHIDGS